MFVLGGEEWCVPVTDVREVLPWQRPTRLADPRPTLRGIVRVRDDLLAVHDVGSLFGGGSGAAGDRTIVAVEVAKLLAALGEKPRPRPRARRRAPKKT